MCWRKIKFKREKKRQEERRKEPRLDDLSEITIEKRDPEQPGQQKSIYYARARNASPSGLKLECQIQFPLGTLVDIKVHSKRTRKEIKARGKVKWVNSLEDGRRYELGVEFVETPVRTIMDLLEHIYKSGIPS